MVGRVIGGARTRVLLGSKPPRNAESVGATPDPTDAREGPCVAEGERVGEVAADSTSELASLSNGFLRSMLGVCNGDPAGVTGSEKGVLDPV
jgi:hypothetical protein